MAGGKSVRKKLNSGSAIYLHWDCVEVCVLLTVISAMKSTIRELVVYVPAENFAVSKSFYAALGFELTEGWGGTFDCRLGGAVFRLQNYYVKDWAENFMMKFDVDDVQAWHEHAKQVIDDGDYSNARYDEPEMIGDTQICHVWDPCGVLLIFIS